VNFRGSGFRGSEVQRFKVQGFKVQGSRVQRLNKTKRFTRLNRVPFGKFNRVNSEPLNL